jgi:RHS repeat-associated protein
VGPDGIITTFAGNGEPGFSGDGGPATQARLDRPNEVAVAFDGSVLIEDYGNYCIRRVGPDGIITTLAGTGTQGYSGDGGPATQATLSSPRGVAVAPDGSVLIADYGNYRIRRVGPDGIITTLAGTGYVLTHGGGFSDGRPATQTNLSPIDVAVAPDGSIFMVEFVNNRILRVGPVAPGFNATDLAITASDGRQVYRFNASGRHLSTVDTLTGTTLYTFAYDSAGRLTTITDADGNVTAIERDSTGQPTAIIAPFGQRTALTVDSTGWLTKVTHPAGEAYQMQYTADGLLTRLTDPRNNASQFTYDALGRLQRDANAAGGSQTLARTEQANGYTATRTTALNRTTTYQVANLPIGDQQRTVTTPDGATTTTLTQTNGTILSTAPDGTVTTMVQGPDPRFGMQAPIVKSLTTASGGLTATQTTAVTVSPSNVTDLTKLTQLTTTIARNGRSSTTVYDAASRTLTTTSAAGRVGRTVLNVQGRVIEAGVTGLAPATFSYDARGRLTSLTQGSGTEARVTTYTYDAAGFLTGLADPLGQATGFASDANGRVLMQTLPNTQTIGFGYDPNSNLTLVTPPGQPGHGFTYNAVDLTTSYLPPTVPSGGDTDYEYNADQQLTQVIRPDGGALNSAYDAAGRLSTLTIPAGQYGYSYNAVSQLTGITAPGNVTLAYSYNQALLTGRAWSGALTGQVGYGYDNDFRISQVTVNDSNPVAYQYDADSLLTQAGDLTLTRSAQNGLLTRTTLGSVTDTYTYNSFGEPTAYTARYNTGNLLNIAYTRDALGRITQKVETVSGGAAVTSAYGYDATGQLIEVKRNGAIIASYSYDANGNRLSKTAAGAKVNGTYDAQDRMLSYGTATYTYTANGELRTKVIGGQTTTCDYDALGNLRSVALPGKRIAYLIDGANRRVGKQVNGVLAQGFLYHGQLQPVAELGSDGVTVVSRFIYGNGINVPDYMVKEGATYRLVTDHLGSPRLVVNTANGTIAQAIDYDEYGKVLSDSNPGFQPFGFAGGLYDPDTGLVRFGARDYDPSTGRWTAKEPLLFDGGATNLYRYAANDPINFIDPDGRFLINAVGAIYGGVIDGLIAASQGKSAAEIAQATAFGAFKGAFGPLGAVLIAAAQGVLEGWDKALADPCDISLRRFISAGIGGGLKGGTTGIVSVLTGKAGGALGGGWRTVYRGPLGEMYEHVPSKGLEAVSGSVGEQITDWGLSRKRNRK